MNPPREIHLHLERLVLDGLLVDRSQSAGLVRALEAELGELFAGSGVNAEAGTALEAIPVQSINWRQTESLRACAAQIARTVHEAVAQTLSPQIRGFEATPARAAERRAQQPVGAVGTAQRAESRAPLSLLGAARHDGGKS